MKNYDQFCFKYSVARALNPVERDGERISKILQLQTEKFCWKGISFPMQLQDITKFENQNPGISVNVFGCEEEVFPLRISKRKGRSVDLFMIGNKIKIILELLKVYQGCFLCKFPNIKRKSFFVEDA